MLTGCTAHPGDFKFCKEHRDEQHPAVISSKLGRENRDRLEAVKDSQRNYKEQDFSDNMYIVEEILDSKFENDVEMFLIKWEDYEDPTWEPASNIPKFMVSFFKKTGNGKVPTPRVAGSRRKGKVEEVNDNVVILTLVGNAKQYQLVWDGDNNLSEWVPEDQIIDLDTAEVPTSKEARTCNTRKDRDKRKNRHTCGIFIG